jgi:hypothetical protein
LLFSSIKSVNLKNNYVYFGLHYEPERTTLPDGDIFHDQFLAILKLREFIPKNIKIYLKEHPSMFYNSLSGYKGRSPLFYSLLNKIEGVEIISMKYNTIDLINSSLFTSTITGTLGIESAIIGKKSLIFGNSWYNGCPNTTKWSSDIKYDQFISERIYDNSSIKKFLKVKLENESLMGLLNSRSVIRFKQYISDEFKSSQFQGIYKTLKKYFKEI